MKNKVFEDMAAKWQSAVVARSEIKTFTGGAISPRTMANLDSMGLGITDRIIIGRHVCYPLESLLVFPENMLRLRFHPRCTISSLYRTF